VADAYARKFGGPERAAAIIDHVTGIAAGEGLEFRMDRALRANTRLAHRLLWWAEQPGSPVSQAALKERLLQAYFHDGLDVGDPDVLADCAAELGADRDAVRALLDGDDGAAEVLEHLMFANDNGITAVPTYVIDGRWAVPGAQESETFVAVLRRMAATRA
jgi:predicted DsbA family dithiol-disulfide isomerase